MDLLHGQQGGELELRRDGKRGKRLRGSFPYNKTATLSDGGRNGRPQKERFASRAFGFRVSDPQSEIHLLVGHSFDRPLASKLNDTLTLRDGDEALTFDAFIAPEIAETTFWIDIAALLVAGLVRGLSPGFRLPPERRVPRKEAETFEDEEVDPENDQFGARIRTIHDALLFELSVVTAPAYRDAEVEFVRSRAAGSIIRPSRVEAMRRWRA